MGKTPKPLNILVHPSLLPWPEMDALKEQGHTVHTMDSGDSMFSAKVIAGLCGYDILFAPNAWYMTKDHKTYLKVAMVLARKLKYPPKPKKKGKKK